MELAERLTTMEHREMAEDLEARAVELALQLGPGNTEVTFLMARAQMHATLAQ